MTIARLALLFLWHLRERYVLNHTADLDPRRADDSSTAVRRNAFLLVARLFFSTIPSAMGFGSIGTVPSSPVGQPRVSKEDTRL